MKKATAVIAVILVLCCMLSACNKAESLTGTWSYNEEGYSISLIFNEDGTGKIYALGGLLTVEYTYKVDGNTIIFHELEQEVLGSTPYTFSIDGDKMSLTGGGDVMVFTKEK